MDLEKTSVVSGLPAPVAVKFLQQFRGPRSLVFGVTPKLDAEYGTVEGALLRLQEDGYVVREDSEHGVHWANTTEGQAVSNKVFTKPITRKTADRVIGEAVDRARAFNADPTRATRVSRLRLFGSYVNTEKDRLGDVDVAVAVHLREPMDIDQIASYARRAGCFLKGGYSPNDWLEWEVHRAVAGRSRAIQTVVHDPAELSGSWTDIFVADGADDAPADLRLSGW